MRLAAARVGVMFNPDNPTDAVQIPLLPPAARAVGVTVEVIEVATLEISTPQPNGTCARMYKGYSLGLLLSGLQRGHKSRPWLLASSCRPCMAGASLRMRAG